MRKSLFVLLCLTASVLARAQSYTYRYWFDEEKAVKTITGGSSQQLNIDMTSVTEGLHALHLQVVDGNNTVSATQTKFVAKNGTQPTGRLHYWFDSDLGNGGVLNASGASTAINVSALAYGIHTIHAQTNGNVPSSIKSAMFVKMPNDVNASQTRYWFDGDMSNGGTLNATGGVVSVNTSKLTEGIHTLHVQNGGNTPSAIKSAMFVKIPSKELGTLTCVTMVDGKVRKREQVTPSGGLFSLKLDTETLSNGLHSVSVELLSANGKPSAIKSALFYKMPTDNKISGYEYWVNDDFEQHKKVDVESSVGEYNLKAMLPMPQKPLRSTAFHFEKVSGEPYIFAKNDFNIRFYDAEARSTEESAEYVDRQTRQKVEDVDTLISDRSVTKDKPEENEIQWYRFAAMPTDSIRIQVNRACTVQVFAPSGEEVFSQTGSTSWETFNAKENGDYYLALHDVTSGSNTTLRFISQRRTLRTGDVNGDGDVDVTDMNLIIDVICGVMCSYDCDVNGDGAVDVTDLNLVIDVICGE